MDFCTYRQIPGHSESPTGEPTSEPTLSPRILTDKPTPVPTSSPTVEHSDGTTSQPSSEPTSQPSGQPSSGPTSQTSSQPSSGPTSQPSSAPSSSPTVEGSSSPTASESPSMECKDTNDTFLVNSGTERSCAWVGRNSGRCDQLTDSGEALNLLCPETCEINCTDFPTSAPTSSPSTGPSVTPSASPTSSSPTRDTPNSSKEVVFDDWSPAHKLGECHGDCDTNNNCLPGLVCYSRNELKEQVPGCADTEGILDTTLADFCIDPANLEGDADSSAAMPSASPTGSLSADPSQSPSQSPSSKPSAGPTTSPSSNPSAGPTTSPSSNPSAGPTDMHSSTPTTSPSAAPSSSPSDNPSVQPTDEKASQRPTGSSSSGPSAGPSASPSSGPTTGSTDTSDSFPALVNHGWNPPSSLKPLGLCEGDCDLDTDCSSGMRCFQRFLPRTKVPGCSGGEDDASLADYCVWADGRTPVPTKVPSAAPSAAPTISSTEKEVDTDIEVDAVPPQISCDDYDVNYNRMCKENSCCENPRSSSLFCHEEYAVLGDAVASACYHCCEEQNGVPKIAGPPPDDHPDDIQKTIGCDEIENPERMCKDGSCCDAEGSTTNWCEEQYGLHFEHIASICWYCCHPSKTVEFDIPTRRELASEEKSSSPEEAKLSEMTEDELREYHRRLDRPISENDKVTYFEGKKYVIREENFERKEHDQEQVAADFDEMLRDYNRRKLLEVNPLSVNYDDVYYWPYEWLVKVGTEYYFRYEGTQAVPPCYETVHWRVMKDPIRVAPHQMRELERLQAWRLNDQCKEDVAGTPREGSDGMAVDSNRPLQEYNTLHRKVFCECKDWPSKFPMERAWCRQKDYNIRLYQNPYNWAQEGF